METGGSRRRGERGADAMLSASAPGAVVSRRRELRSRASLPSPRADRLGGPNDRSGHRRARFIGSRLCGHLLRAGDEVSGVEAFTACCGRWRKEQHLSACARDRPSFFEGDLSDPLVPPPRRGRRRLPPRWPAGGAGVARPGVRRLLPTQRPRHSAAAGGVSGTPAGKEARLRLERIGSTARPVRTRHPSRLGHSPSPYGVTKLAEEHLCEAFALAFGVPTVCLRLFTADGPRQRPDMAFSRLASSTVSGRVFELYGNSNQTRDFRFVGDVVTAMRDPPRLSGQAWPTSEARVSLNEAVTLVRSIHGPLKVAGLPPRRSDVRHAGADIRVAAAAVGYRPRTTLERGLQAMVEWERSQQPVLA